MIEGQEDVSWEQWVALARACEEHGVDALFRSDHYRGGLRAPGASLDAWTTLAGLAAITSRVRLGTMVSPVTFRYAAVLAKSVVTVDHISDGRAELGIGAGWNEREHAEHAIPFPPPRERVRLLGEQVETIVRHWTETADPKPVQQPHPPLIVGGTAKPGTLAPAVRYADEYNTVSPSVDEARERARRVADAARKAGREPLHFSMMIGCVVGRDAGEVAERLAHIDSITGRHAEPPPIAGTLEEVVDRLRQYEAAGVERAMLQHLYHEDLELVALLGEVADALRR